jgi:hypothetical protein
MMLIGRSSRRENLLRVTGIEPRFLIRTCPREPHQGQQPREWLHQQARHMTAPDRNRHHANSALDAGAPSTHDPSLPCGRCATTRGLVAQCRKRSSSVNRRVHSCRGRADCADTKR